MKSARFLRAAHTPPTRHHFVPRKQTSASRTRRGAPDGGEPATTASLLDALRALDRELRLLSQREESQAARDTLPPARARVLRVLAERPANSLAALAERTHTDPSSVSVVVQRLVDDGLVARTIGSDDRRRTELSITSAGRARLRREPTTVERRLDDAVATLGEQRAALVARGLQVLASALRPQESATNAAERPTRRSAGTAGR